LATGHREIESWHFDLKADIWIRFDEGLTLETSAFTFFSTANLPLVINSVRW